MLSHQIVGGELDGVDSKFKARLRQKVGWHVDALLVLDNKVKFQGHLLEFGERLSSGLGSSLKRLMISEKDEPLAAKLFPDISGGPDHRSHLQEK